LRRRTAQAVLAARSCGQLGVWEVNSGRSGRDFPDARLGPRPRRDRREGTTRRSDRHRRSLPRAIYGASENLGGTSRTPRAGVSSPGSSLPPRESAPSGPRHARPNPAMDVARSVQPTRVPAGGCPTQCASRMGGPHVERPQEKSPAQGESRARRVPQATRHLQRLSHRAMDNFGGGVVVVVRDQARTWACDGLASFTTSLAQSTGLL